MSFNFTNPDIALLDISSNCVSTSITLTISPIKECLCQVSLWIFSNCRNLPKWKTMFYLCKHQFSESRNSIPNEDCPKRFFFLSLLSKISSLAFLCHSAISAFQPFPIFPLLSFFPFLCSDDTLVMRCVPKCSRKRGSSYSFYEIAISIYGDTTDTGARTHVLTMKKTTSAQCAAEGATVTFNDMLLSIDRSFAQSPSCLSDMLQGFAKRRKCQHLWQLWPPILLQKLPTRWHS